MEVTNDLVAAERYVAGQPIPASLEAQVRSQARLAPSDVAYRIDGTGRRAVSELAVPALILNGLTPALCDRLFVTPSAMVLAQSEAVFKITPVLGPMAQGQGSTRAAAHRLDELYPVNQPDGLGDPALDGSGVAGLTLAL